jgi:hypothetical protein
MQAQTMIRTGGMNLQQAPILDAPRECQAQLEVIKLLPVSSDKFSFVYSVRS